MALGRTSRRTTRDAKVYHRQVVGKGEPFKLTSIVKEEPPTGTEGVGWHRYVINQGGENTIVGHTQGSANSVGLAVEEILVSLNERRRGNFGRVHLIPGPKKRE